MKRLTRSAMAAVLGLALISSAGFAAEEGQISKSQRRRGQIDHFAAQTMKKLFQESPKAKRLYDGAVGYAVFDSAKFAIAISGGGGVGVAVDKVTGKNTYMKMGTAGIGFGLGGQVYQLVFLFEDKETFNKFVEHGWEAGASANAVAGKAGANAGTSFINGVAVYQITEAGLMLQADIAGTKYWQYHKLNRF